VTHIEDTITETTRSVRKEFQVRRSGPIGIQYNSMAIPEGKTLEPPSNVMTSLSVHGDMMMWKAGCGAEVNKVA